MDKKKLKYDIFLSYSYKDKLNVKRLAERLRDDGVRVWFDHWEIKPGDDIVYKIEQGIALSRVLVLVMSPNTFGSDWVRLERNTIIFRDPINKERRFIPFLIEACQIPDNIKRYKYIDWQEEANDGYKQLLQVCRSIPKPKEPETHYPLVTFERKLAGHQFSIRSVIITPDGNKAISGSYGNAIEIWDPATGKHLTTLIGHLAAVYSVAVTSDGNRVISGSDDNTIKLWDLKTNKCLSTLRGHDITVRSVAEIKDKNYVLSGSIDKTLKLWDLNSGHCLHTFRGHDGYVHSVAVTPDGKYAISGSSDKTLKLWDLESKNFIATLKGHDDYIFSVDVTPCGKHALSGAGDNTLKLWDLVFKRCLATFEGHSGRVYGVAVSPDGQIAASASQDNTVKLWDLKTGACLQTLHNKYDSEVDSQPWNVAFNPNGANLIIGTREGSIYIWRFKSIKSRKLKKIPVMVQDQIRYTNAKVVLVGESGVGKTSLAYRLAENLWKSTFSTHGMQVWPFKQSKEINIQREVLLWDLAGQPAYRIIHHLFLDETALALVVFDPSDPHDPFKGIGEWEKSLRTAIGHESEKLLVAARCDRGGATITEDKIKCFLQEHGYVGYVATSAMTSDGCSELKDSIIKNIPWDKIPWISTTNLFKELKEAIIGLKDESIVLIRFSELFQQLQIRLPDESFNEQDLRSVIGLLAGQGLLKPFAFGDFVLLQPEQLNNYASAVINAAREHVDGIGAILEQDVIESRFKFNDPNRLSKEDEEILLRAIVQICIDQSLCIREETPHGVQLVFPSQFNREMPDIPDYPNIIITYRFSGQLEAIYATLVVRLNYSDWFIKKDLWKNAAEFLSPTKKKRVGFKMEKIGEGRGEIKVFFDSGISDDTRVIFVKYIHEHLIKRAVDVEREREYFCPNCNYPVYDRKVIKKRLQSDKKYIFCHDCGTKIELIDLIEQRFATDIFKKKVQELDVKAQINLDKESRELIIVGQAYTIAAEAGQLFHHYPDSDHGVDGEIEFINNKGKASGRKIYLQLKYEDSYLYTHQEDDKEGKYSKEIFVVRNENENYIRYWQCKDGPVYLVIRTLTGEIQWMDITEYFRIREYKSSKIIFSGNPFNYSSLIKLRDKYIFENEYSELKWNNLSDENFERLIFALISNTKGYENPEWFMKTNAPDRGRDLSVIRVNKDPLSGTQNSRIIIQCKHWLTKSISLNDVIVVKDQIKLWEPPRVNALVIATSGRFTSDAVAWVEKHNESGNPLKIEIWPESHLERLLAIRPALIEKFGLK